MIKRTIEESKPKHKKVNFYTASFFFFFKKNREVWYVLTAQTWAASVTVGVFRSINNDDQLRAVAEL
jgi:hypothetical protein